MNTLRKNRYTFSRALIMCSPLFFYLLLVSFAEAAGQYIPIVAIPGLNDQITAGLPAYINRIYFFTITIGALYGVVKIAFAGVKYSMSDVVTDKGSAIKDIQGVLLGLAILLIPFIVLRTINPELTRLDVLSNVKNKIDLISGSSGGLSEWRSSTAVSGTPGANKAGVTRSSCYKNPALCASDCEANGGKVTTPTEGKGTGIVFCDYYVDP